MVLLVAALALFAVGSPSGSLDVNGDGDPEVPIVVLESSKGVSLLRAVSKDHRSGSVTGIEQLLSAVVKNQFEGIRVTKLASHLPSSTPSSFDLLRC